MHTKESFCELFMGVMDFVNADEKLSTIASILDLFKDVNFITLL